MDLNLRKSIIDEASSWLGTSFHHQGRVKKNNLHNGGVDCLGLIMGIAKSLNLKSTKGNNLINYDRTDYPKVTKGELSILMKENFLSIPNDNLKIADIILFKIGKYQQHVGMLHRKEGGDLYMIHSHLSPKIVASHIIDDYWRSKIESTYRFADLLNSNL